MIEIKKIGKLGPGGLAEAEGLCQTNLLTRTAVFIWVAEGKWDRVSRKLIKQCCLKCRISSVSQTDFTVALGLITTAAPDGEELGSKVI